MTPAEAKIIQTFGSPQLIRLLKLASWGSQERIVATDVMRRFGVSLPTAKRDMSWLRKHGLVLQYGSRDARLERKARLVSGVRDAGDDREPGQQSNAVGASTGAGCQTPHQPMRRTTDAAAS